MASSIESAARRPLDELVEAFNRAFEGYVGGEISLDREGLMAFAARQRVDLKLSRVALDGGRTIALALVSRRGGEVRLAAMGVRPEAQGGGVGTALMEDLLARARERGDRRFELEVIEQNPAGVALYTKVGFRRQQRLLEFRRSAPAEPPPVGALERIEVAEAARAAIVDGDRDLPWPLTGFDLISLGPPSAAFRLGAATAIVTAPADPSAGPARLEALTVAASERRRGHGRALLDALAGHYPHHHWHIVANCPERFRPFLEACGFRLGPLSQLHLERDL